MTERTRARATKVVSDLAVAQAARPESSDIRPLLTVDLVTRLLDTSWRLQFEDDRSAPRRYLKGLISDAIEEHLLRETS